MKRRDFLIGATGSTSLLYLKPASALVPCPPIMSGATAATCSAIDAEQDWQSRISGPGVVWHHNFASEAEVSRYRWQSGYGNITDDSGDGSCRHITTDGITGGGCLEIAIPTGGKASQSWIRPFSPLTAATNGRGEADPGAGTITPLAWDVHGNATDDFYDYIGKWKHGTYSHKDYWDHARNGGNGYACDGDEFYIQFRVKIDSKRITPGNPGGKLAGVLICGNGNSHVTPNQELVMQADASDARVECYTNFGNKPQSRLYENQSDGLLGEFFTEPRQGGSAFTECYYNNGINATNCGSWPLDEWVTCLLHFKAGHDGGGGNSPVIAGNTANDTTFEMLIAGANETSYTVMYSKNDFVWSFGEFDSTPLGWSAFKPWGFMNGVNAVEGWYQRYDEVIFSKEFIPCPQV